MTFVKNKYKTIFFILLFVKLNLAQVGYVGVNDEIYSYLDRMYVQGILDNYNSFELPKSRNTIKNYLVEIIKNYDRLTVLDQNKLTDFISEFELDLTKTLNKSESLYPNWKINYLFSDNEKYLYSYHDNKDNSFFVNFVGKLDYLHKSNYNANSINNSTIYRFGGKIRGTFHNKIGFEITATNGSFLGSKTLAQNFSSLKYNYKFNNTTTSKVGAAFFDETSAFLAFENKFLELKIGNDRKIIGHGFNKSILSNSPPRMEYLSLALKYNLLNFTFFHGKLLGNQSLIVDSLQGNFNKVSDKYLAYHRIGLNFSRNAHFGIGEMIIYANRNIDFSYLNPINFYKSAEHANQDRDNSFLFLDFINNTIEGLKIYSTILIDDIDFGKIGRGWYGNQSLISVGFYSALFYEIMPLDVEFQYTKIDPYVFTHRISDNNFTNKGFNLGSELSPNSSSSLLLLYFRPHYRINLTLGMRYTLHGANVLNSKGELVTNYGGNILVGHRPFDSEEVYFLQGDREVFREYILNVQYEPIKDWSILLNVKYLNNTLARSQSSKELFTTFSIITNL